MRSKSILMLILTISLLLFCCACGAQKDDSSVSVPSDTAAATTAAGTETTAAQTSAAQTTAAETTAAPQTEASTEELTPAEISERAMENFVRKLQAGNYVVGTKAYAFTNVASPDQVYIVFGDEESTLTYAYMTLNGETFEATIRDGVMEEVAFASTDCALDMLEPVLPNSWITLSGGNLFELFYNSVDHPLEFTSNDENVKRIAGALAGYGEFSLSRMEELHMVLDDVDPSSVHFTAVLTDDSMIRYDDLDMTLSFGTAVTDPDIDAWLSAPEYPETRTGWTKKDINMLDMVFMRGYGKQIPFPEAASYAMIFDEDAYKLMGGFSLSDSHQTESDVEAYKALLLDKGFEEVSATLPDGSSGTAYRLPLRKEYQAYAELYLAYDDGFLLEGRLTHDSPEYDGLAAISEAVSAHGFTALPDTELFTGWTASDIAAARTEDWSYFFDYELYMSFPLSFEDADAAAEYLENYKNSLIENGFLDVYVPGGNGGKCESSNAFTSFAYSFSAEADQVMLTFKKEKSLTLEETLALLKEHGFPETDISGDIACRDQTRYQYEMGEFEGLFLFCYQPFESAEAATAFLDAYVPVLMDLGYYSMDPMKLGSYRQYLWYNEDLRKYVAFDYLPEENSATITWEFFSAESALDSSILSAALHLSN